MEGGAEFIAKMLILHNPQPPIAQELMAVSKGSDFCNLDGLSTL